MTKCLLQGNKLFCAWTNSDPAALNFIVRAYKSVPAPTGNPLPVVRCTSPRTHHAPHSEHCRSSVETHVSPVVVPAVLRALACEEEVKPSRALYVRQATRTATVTASSVTFVNGIAPGDTYWFQVSASSTLVVWSCLLLAER